MAYHHTSDGAMNACTAYSGGQLAVRSCERWPAA